MRADRSANQKEGNVPFGGTKGKGMENKAKRRERTWVDGRRR